MRCARLVLLISVIALSLATVVVAASAAPDQPTSAPVAPAASAPAAPAGQVPPLPENAAEIAAIANGELVLDPAPATAAAGARALSPEMVEINAVLTAERAQVDDLTARLQATTDNAAALALEREIEAAKQSTELAILGIQARCARAAGREEQAQAIEAAIAQMTAVMDAPATATAPAVTPAPRPADGAR